MAYTGLAKTTFSAGPEEALIAADAYKENDIKSASFETVDYSLSLPESPLGVKIKPPEISGIGLKPPTLDKADILKAVVSNDRNIKNCFTNMSEAAKGLLEIPGKLLGKVEATINGVVTSIKNLSGKKFDLKGALEKIGDLGSIGCTVNTLSNGAYSLSILDKGGMSGLIAGVTSQASLMGVNNVFSTISNVVNDKDILLNACKQILPAASRDIALLKDLSSTDIGKSIKTMMPSISGDSIKNFRINPGTSFNSLPNLFSDIKYTLNNVDASWNKVVRDSGSVLSGINTVSKKSEDFHKALSSSVMTDYSLLPTKDSSGNYSLSTSASDDAFLMTTNGIGEQDVSNLFKLEFPSLPIIVNPETSTQSLAERTIVGTDSLYTFYQTSKVSEDTFNTIKIQTNSQTDTTIVSNNNSTNEKYETNPKPIPQYPPLGTYLGTTEKTMSGNLVRIETRQGAMNDSNPSYDHVITIIRLSTSEIFSTEHVNTPTINPFIS